MSLERILPANAFLETFFGEESKPPPGQQSFVSTRGHEYFSFLRNNGSFRSHSVWKSQWPTCMCPISTKINSRESNWQNRSKTCTTWWIYDGLKDRIQNWVKLCTIWPNKPPYIQNSEKQFGLFGWIWILLMNLWNTYGSCWGIVNFQDN